VAWVLRHGGVKLLGGVGERDSCVTHLGLGAPVADVTEQALDLLVMLVALRGEFGRLKSWLNEKVHRPGRRYSASRLCERITGRPLEHAPLVSYLRRKYGAFYELS